MNGEQLARGETTEAAAAGGAPRVALVAGGGAVKAYAYHVGVAAGLAEDGFFFRSGVRWQPSLAPPGSREIGTYVGCSAGACVVASLASGHEVKTLAEAVLGTSAEVPTFGYRTLFVPVAPNPLRYLSRLARRWRLGGLRPSDLLQIGGLLTTSGVEKYFRKNVVPTNRFGDLAARLYVTATQVNGSRKVVFGPVDSRGQGGYDPSCAYYDNVPVSQAVAAAIAVPPVFAPYAIVNPSTGKRFHYYDSEVRETLSLNVAREAGADFAVASSIWRPYAYDERVGTIADLGMGAVAEQALHQAIEQKVHQDREQAELYDRLLELVEARAARRGLAPAEAAALRGEVGELLHHRPVRTLYVTPEEGDHAFMFEGSFRFSRRLLEHCIDAGRRAYRAALRRDPGFLAALDGALARAASPSPATVSV